MPTLTANYSLQKPLVNNATDQDLWGDELNDDLDDIDTLLKSGITINVETSQTTGFSATVSISVKKLYPCDATSAAFAATLPTAASAGNGATVYFKKIDSTSNAITITRAGSDTIDGATTSVISAQYDVVGLVSDGVSAWEKLNSIPAVFTGDSGSGGASGLVPAPASGTAAKRYVLGAGGSFSTQTCIQTASYETGASATGTTVMPYDDSIPQNTEGDEYMSLVFTPKDAANKLIIDICWNGTINTANSIQVALFQDATANALAAASQVNGFASGLPLQVNFKHKMTAGTTSPTTFKVRAGPSSSANTTFNGQSGGRIFGGVMASSITVTEVSE